MYTASAGMASIRAGENYVDLFLASLDSFLELSASFPECQAADKQRLLEKAEQTLRDVVYLEPILPEGPSIVSTVNEVISCMREECDALLFREPEQRGRGRPAFAVSKEQLLFLLEHGFTQCAISKILGCTTRTVKHRITSYQLDSYLHFTNINDDLLDLIIQDIQKQYPNWGEKKCAWAFVFNRSKGPKVARTRLSEACVPLFCQGAFSGSYSSP